MSSVFPVIEIEILNLFEYRNVSLKFSFPEKIANKKGDMRLVAIIDIHFLFLPKFHH